MRHALGRADTVTFEGTLVEKGGALLARPLLSWARRGDTATYCQRGGVEFRADEMNNDERFARIRVRTQLLPLMQSFNPKMVEALARTAEVLREDNHALDSAAGRLFELSIATNESAGAGGKDCPSLRTDLLASSPSALRRRALRQWLRNCRGDLRRINVSTSWRSRRYCSATGVGELLSYRAARRFLAAAGCCTLLPEKVVRRLL